jgi:hypothetical protein
MPDLFLPEMGPLQVHGREKVPREKVPDLFSPEMSPLQAHG